MASPTPVVVESLTTLDFRNLDDESVPLGPALTVIVGPNGAGKTNLLEAVYFALVGRSCRTSNSRNLVAFGKPLARAEAVARSGVERRHFLAAISHADGHRHLVDGAEPRGPEVSGRPAVAVFMPDRLALIKGPPAARRAHLDRLIAALWPARREARASFGRALAQRNALLGRVRGGLASESALDAWDMELAAVASAVIEARLEACELLAAPFSEAGVALGLPGEPEVGYQPRCEHSDADSIAAELRARRSSDIDRGFTTRGPHLDEINFALSGRSLRRYGSQGQQRTSLLALLFAERELLLERRDSPPLMLLDDVMSELDPDRRRLLVSRLAQRGQTLLTATDLEQLPDSERAELTLDGGRVSRSTAAPPSQAPPAIAA